MRVVAVEAAIADPPATRTRSLNIECLGLAIATAVAMFGIGLAYSARLARLAETAPSGAVIPLYALESPAQLEPALTMYDSAYERTTVARALFSRATAAPRLSVRSASDFTTHYARSIVLFVLAFWAAHIVRRLRRRSDDPLLLPPVMLLCGLGLTTMTALRDPIRDAISASTFAGGVAAGVLLLVAISEVDFEASRLRRAVIAPLAAACALAALLLAFGSGP